MTALTPPRLSWTVWPFLGLCAADVWLLAQVGTEALDAPLALELGLHAILHVCTAVSFFAVWWGLASLAASHTSDDPADGKSRLAFASLLGASALAFAAVTFGTRLQAGWGSMSLLCLAGAFALVGAYLLAPRLIPRGPRVQWGLLVAVTVGGVAFAILCGVSTPPIFPKVNRGPIAAALGTLLLWFWLYQAITRPPFPKRSATRLVLGGLVAFGACSAVSANLSMRSTHVVSETLEGVRSLRALGRNVTSVTGLADLWTPGHHGEWAAREVEVHEMDSLACMAGDAAHDPSACQQATTAVSCSVDANPRARSLLLLSLDAFRTDHFGVDLQDLPTLRRLQDTSLLFERAAQASSGTKPSLFSMHTGRYPLRASPVLDAWPAVAQTLGADYEFRIQGWDGALTQTTADLTDALIETMSRAAAQKKPFLIHAHYMSLHMVGLARHDYTGALPPLDKEVGRLLDALKSLGLADETLVIVTGDHGEEDRDVRGYAGHGYGAWETSVVTPLMVHLEGVTPGRDQTRVSGADIWPTALDALGVRCDYEMHGVSLLAEVPTSRPIFSSGTTPNPTSLGLLFSDIHAVVVDDWKLTMDLRQGSTALYDLSHDPQERHNLADSEPAKRAALGEILRAYVLDLPHTSPSATTAP